MSDVATCAECKATEETQPLYGIGEDGLCLVCRDKRQEERGSIIADRLRAKLEEKESKQSSMGVFA